MRQLLPLMPSREYKPHMKLYGCLVFLLASLFTLICRSEATPTDFEGWASASALTSLDDAKTYQLFLELQPRIGDDWHRAALVLVRPAVVYNPTKALSLYTGYAWHPTFYNSNYHRDYRDEQRLWQQVIYRHDLWGTAWLHRLRQEQRKIEHTDGISNRTRYLLRGSYGLTDAGDVGITTFEELMINLNGVDGGPWAGYDRSRVFLGPYWLVGSTRYEIGYLGEHAKRFGDDERWVNAIAISGQFNF